MRSGGPAPRAVAAEAQTVGPLMLGMGWFPADTGGLARYFRGLFEALGTEGLNPRAVVVGPAEHPPAGVSVTSRAGAPLPLRLLGVARAARGAARSAPTSVDAHFALYAALPLSLKPLRGLPVMVHFHGPWAGESLASGQGSLAASAKRAVERRVYRRADRIVVLSSAFRRLLVERYGVAPWSVDVIPPGIDLAHFTPGDGHDRDRLGIPEDAWVVLAARQLVPRMGLDVLLRAWAAAPPPRGLLAIAGEGPERGGLEALARGLGVAEEVRFLGRVDDNMLRAWYRAADVSVVPSLALEGFGLVVLEALACGTPVVVSDAGGLPEAVAGLDGALVVPAGDEATLATRLEQARAASVPLPTPQACREHAERFTWERAAQRHRRAYAAATAPVARTRPRVVYLDHTAALSGGELALLRLLRALDGVDAHVILAEEGPLARRLADAGISCEVMPMAENARGLRRGRISPGGLPAAAALSAGAYAARLARRLRALKPDLVHTNSLKAAVYGTAAARVAGIPVVWHLHDRLSSDYLPGPAVRLMRGIARTLPHAIIANSETSRATLPRVRCRVEVIPCGVDPIAADAGGHEVDGPLRVGVVGRIAPWKGQHLFLEGFASAFPDGMERAVLIGAPLFGEQDYEAALHDDVARLGLQGRVEFRGFRDDVPAELARLDVLVHSSVIQEPLGQTVLEGMAAGLPVVVPDEGGPAEIVADARTGLLYRLGDADAMADALRRLHGDSGLRVRLGSDARDAVAAYAPRQVAERVERLYADVLAAPKAAG